MRIDGGEGEMNFFSFFQSSPDLFFVFDKEGFIIEANKMAAEKLQYKPEELLGKSIYSLHPADLRKDAEVYLLEILDSKRSYCPIPLISKTGELLYVETKISRGQWNGKPAIFSLSKDLTEKRQAEELAKRNEERYRILFENINDSVFVHEFTDNGLPGRFLEVNELGCQRLGYSKQELLCMTPSDIDAPESRALIPKVMQQLAIDGHIVWEGVHITKKGVRIPVEISNHLFNLEGKKVILATVRDITERKSSEDLLLKQNEEYAALNRELRWRNDQILMINKELQQASDIFVNIRTGLHIYHLEDINDDMTLRMIGTNPAAETLTGLHAGDILGNTLDENFPGLRAKGIPQAYAEVIRTRIPKQFDELIYGDDRILEGAFTLNAFPLPDNCVGVSFENVTEQFRVKDLIIQNNKQLMEAKEKAEESDRLKSAFLANMSHEIRTPMNGIMGFSMMLADHQLPRETRDSYLKIINSSCEQLLHIVNDIIDISKIEAGQIDINESAFDLRIMLNELFSIYSSASKEKGIMFEIDHERCNLDSDSWIVSDRTKLRQILENLYSNAVKFTPSGRIIFRCEHVNGFISFEVEDSGIGIEPGLQNVIFERFRQVESSYTKTYGGTGLGLAITKAYIEKMGGSIKVHSEIGKGSVFSFRLPYKPASEQNKEEPVSRFRPLDLGMTILVVEDEEINWLYLNEILKNRVKVLHAVNGKEAVELVRLNKDIDIILMDIKLPDINGLELTKIIKSMNGRIKVIAQTAYALSGDRESVIEAGCSGYISKPVNRDELLNLIIAYSDK